MSNPIPQKLLVLLEYTYLRASNGIGEGGESIGFLDDHGRHADVVELHQEGIAAVVKLAIVHWAVVQPTLVPTIGSGGCTGGLETPS